MSIKIRCFGSKAGQQFYADYHDEEWGIPVHDDRHLFEMLILEGAQAGLSWTTILKKRENYRVAFSNFEPEKVAAYNVGKLEELRNNPGIVRNKLKIGSAVTNASLILELIAEFGSFNSFIWKFVNDIPIQNYWEELSDIPSSTPESKKMSKELKRRGFKFIGPTICYSFMQAVGMVNDHTVDCFRHNQLISDISK